MQPKRPSDDSVEGLDQEQERNQCDSAEPDVAVHQHNLAEPDVAVHQHNSVETDVAVHQHNSAEPDVAVHERDSADPESHLNSCNIPHVPNTPSAAVSSIPPSTPDDPLKEPIELDPRLRRRCLPELDFNAVVWGMKSMKVKRV